jgi:hypothetical protein
MLCGASRDLILSDTATALGNTPSYSFLADLPCAPAVTFTDPNSATAKILYPANRDEPAISFAGNVESRYRKRGGTLECVASCMADLPKDDDMRQFHIEPTANYMEHARQCVAQAQCRAPPENGVLGRPFVVA